MRTLVAAAGSIAYEHLLHHWSSSHTAKLAKTVELKFCIWNGDCQSLVVSLHFLTSCFLFVSVAGMTHLPTKYKLPTVTAAPSPATRMICLDKCFPPGCKMRGIWETVLWESHKTLSTRPSLESLARVFCNMSQADLQRIRP